MAELGVDEGGVGVLPLWAELLMYYREVVGSKNESRTAHQLETLTARHGHARIILEQWP